MGVGVGRHNLKTFGTTVYGLTHPKAMIYIVIKGIRSSFGRLIIRIIQYHITQKDLDKHLSPPPEECV